MNGIAVLISLAAVGVDYGWQPTEDGQLEYIIQIEPGLLEDLKSGEEIVSEIPPQARGARKVRIRVGNGPVPRVGGNAPAADSSSVLPPRGGNRRAAATANPAATSSGVMAPTANGLGNGGLGNGGLGNGGLGNGGLGNDEFRPDGRLNLPPPPPLLGEDGLNSVLVRPGSGATSDPPSAPGTNEVLPPDGTATGEFRGGMPLDSPRGSEFGGSGGGVAPPVVLPPAAEDSTGADAPARVWSCHQVTTFRHRATTFRLRQQTRYYLLRTRRHRTDKGRFVPFRRPIFARRGPIRSSREIQGLGHRIPIRWSHMDRLRRNFRRAIQTHLTRRKWPNRQSRARTRPHYSRPGSRSSSCPWVCLHPWRQISTWPGWHWASTGATVM